MLKKLTPINSLFSPGSPPLYQACNDVCKVSPWLVGPSLAAHGVIPSCWVAPTQPCARGVQNMGRKFAWGSVRHSSWKGPGSGLREEKQLINPLTKPLKLFLVNLFLNVVAKMLLKTFSLYALILICIMIGTVVLRSLFCLPSLWHLLC